MIRPTSDNDPVVSRALHTLASWHPSVVSVLHTAARPELSAEGYSDDILVTLPGERWSRLAARLRRPLNLLGIIG